MRGSGLPVGRVGSASPPPPSPRLLLSFRESAALRVRAGSSRARRPPCPCGDYLPARRSLALSPGARAARPAIVLLLLLTPSPPRARSLPLSSLCAEEKRGCAPRSGEPARMMPPARLERMTARWLQFRSGFYRGCRCGAPPIESSSAKRVFRGRDARAGARFRSWRAGCPYRRVTPPLCSLLEL